MREEGNIVSVVTALVVDDSAFFRKRITEILNASGEIKVVGTAQNGVEAIEKAIALKPDVITMDFEMPTMDGITAVRQIMQKAPTAILMFSSLTFDGASVTFDALAAGALDFLPKNFHSVSKGAENKRVLLDKLLALVRKKDREENLKELATNPAILEVLTQEKPVHREAVFSSHASVEPVRKNILVVPFSGRLIIIGASTGGPNAIQKILVKLPENFPYPIVIVQHMPAAFTSAFSERLDDMCNIKVKEAVDNDPIMPGTVLVAPGGKQLIFRRGKPCVVSILEGDERLHYKPSVDISFGSAAKCYGQNVLAIVLTGMGADGREGARLLKREQATVWAQDPGSCVVYGMPMAVQKAGLVDEEVKLDMIADRLIREARDG